jgi:hypothetical protein
LKRNEVRERAVPTRKVADHRDDRASAGTDAVNGRNDRLRTPAHCLDQIAGHAREREQAGRVHLRQRADDVVHVAAEQKLSPAPLITTALTARSPFKERNRSRSSAYDSNVSGFLRSGRFSTTRPSPPSTDH